MIRIWHNIVGLLFIVVVASCSTQQMICPAYQSAFIHDEEALRKRFSYFGEDSLPKILEASKDKHLLIDPVTYRRKMRSLQTVPMQDVYYEEPDSLAFQDDLSDELALAERDVKQGDLYNEEDLLKEMPDESGEDAVASGQDSIYMISLKKEKFNIDQELYLWYMRKFLVYPDVKLQMEENLAQQATEEKEEKVGFFKRLFGGKKKNKNDSTAVDVEGPALGDEEGGEKKKKGFSLFKKKDKSKKGKKSKKDKDAADEAVVEDEEEEESDDGDEDF